MGADPRRGSGADGHSPASRDRAVNGTPRPSSTLVVLRDAAAGGAPEVLLVRRPENAAFAPGASVFPGGAVESQDSGAEAVSAAGGQGAAFTGRLAPGAFAPGEALAYALAALRETFEETLLLLAEPGPGMAWPPVQEREAGRASVLGGKISFGRWLSDSGLRPALSGLRYFAHWITPEGLPIRFDTRFFAAAAPQDQTISLDANELSGYSWIAAARALDQGRSGERYLMPPTRRTLEAIAAFDTLGGALEGLGRGGVQPVMPRAVKGPDGQRIMLFPGDPGYET